MKLALLGTLVTDSILLAFGILTGSIAARLLLPEGRGVLAAILFWPHLLASVGLWSLNEAATYRVGIRPERAPAITAASLWFAVCLAGLTCITGYSLLPFLLGEQRAELASLSRVYLLAFIPSHFLGLTLLAPDHGRLRFVLYNVLRLLAPFVYLVGLVALWIAGLVSVVWVAAVNCLGVVLVAFGRVVIQGRVFLKVPDYGELKTLFVMVARFHPATLILIFSAHADRFVVLTLFDDVALGHYVAALAIAWSGPAVVSNAFQRVLFPHLANVRDSKVQGQLLARAIRHSGVILAAVSLPLLLVIPQLLPFLFGHEFSDAVQPALILVVAHLFVGLETIVIQSLRGFGDGVAGCVAPSLSLVTFLAAAWPLAHAFGLSGVAMALGLANAIALGYLAFHLRRQYKLSFRDLWGFTPGTLAEVLRATLQLKPSISRTAG